MVYYNKTRQDKTRQDKTMFYLESYTVLSGGGGGGGGGGRGKLLPIHSLDQQGSCQRICVLIMRITSKTIAQRS